MIGSVRGRVLERRTTGEVLVEVSGLGYRVNVTARTIAALREDAETFLYTHHHVREDAQLLYGFESADERNCFEALISAHGVGPALAMAILSTHQPDALRVAVATSDEPALCMVPGVGKKTAQRLIMELKSKLDVPDITPTIAPGPGGVNATAEVRDALTGLGYSMEEIREATAGLTGSDKAVLLREALQRLGSRRA
jgi:holliday junction DNA helicase RuvA